MKRNILDLSHWNTVKDWDKVKLQCDGVIIKCGGSDSADGHTYKDVKFEEYYQECKKRDIPVGCYYFGVGSGFDKGRYDATRFYEMIKNKQFDMPVFIDYEKGNKKTKKDNTDYVIGFCDTMENYGYFVGIYASDISGFHDMLLRDDLLDYAWWVARYGTEVKYALRNMQMWQYTSTGKVDGIIGNVDRSLCYIDYPKLIKGGGFNGYRNNWD